MKRADWAIAWAFGMVHVVVALTHKWFFGLTLYFPNWDDNWHAIPINLLRDNLWESLFYLHYQPPLYNLFGALFIHISPEYFHEWIWAVNIGLCAMMVVMLYAISMVIIPNRKIVVPLAFLFAINPTFIVHQASLLYTIHVTFGLVVSIFGVARYQQTRKVRYLYLIVLGAVLTILIRSSFLVFLLIPIYILIGILAEHRWKRLMLISLLISLPAWGWFIKNVALYGIISSSGGGYNMLIIASAEYSRHALHQAVRDGVVDETALMPKFPPSLFTPLGYDKASDVPLLALDTVHNINIPDIFARMMKNGVALIRHDPWQYGANVYRAFKIFSINPYDETKPVNWHSDWMYQWDWRRVVVVYDDVTDFVMHGRQLIEPLTKRLGIISVNSWLFFLIPVSMAGYWLVVIGANRFNIRRWRVYIQNHATWLLVAFYALYGLLIYTFLEIGENDRFRGELEPLYFLLIVAVAYHWLWQSRYRLRYGVLFGTLLVGWTGFAMLMDYPYLRKEAYTVPIHAPGASDGHVFGDVLRLTWREPLISDHAPSSLISIPMYWEVLHPTDAIYTVTVQLLDANQNRVTGLDVVLGSAQPPFVTTSRWQVGMVLREVYTLELSTNAPAITDLVVNVFQDRDWQNSLRYTLPNGIQTGDQFLRLQSFGMLTDEVYPSAEAGDMQFIIGEVALSDIALPAMLSAGDTLSLSAVMTAHQAPTHDYIFFVHVFDAMGQLVAQADSLYVWENWTTSALIPNRPIAYVHVVDMPPLSSGIYEVRFGAYILPQDVRVILTDDNGNRLPDDVGVWGTVQIIDHEG